MSAPVTDRTAARGGGTRTRAAGGVRVAPVRTPVVPPQRRAGDGRSARGAAVRAYAKRDERARGGRASAARGASAGASSGRPRFVVLMMLLLASGLVATLWLSTAAAADSYRLEDARTAAREMSEQSERLHREVASMSSPTSLAERASGLGMVPVQDSARLVVDTDGEVAVVGTPHAAVAPAPPAPPVPEGCAPAPEGAAEDGTPTPAPDCPAADEENGGDQERGDDPASDESGGAEPAAPSGRGTGG